MKRTQRLMLEELSVKAYGTKTRYKKNMERGIRMELKDEDGRKYEGYQRFDVEEIEALMNEEIEEKAKKLEEENARKQSKLAGTEPTNS